jgi:hypothetical protein
MAENFGGTKICCGDTGTDRLGQPLMECNTYRIRKVRNELLINNFLGAVCDTYFL